LLFSAITVTGKSTWSHPALAERGVMENGKWAMKK
jgi:hypothetical protein